VNQIKGSQNFRRKISFENKIEEIIFSLLHHKPIFLICETSLENQAGSSTKLQENKLIFFSPAISTKHPFVSENVISSERKVEF